MKPRMRQIGLPERLKRFHGGWVFGEPHGDSESRAFCDFFYSVDIVTGGWKANQSASSGLNTLNGLARGWLFVVWCGCGSKGWNLKDEISTGKAIAVIVGRVVGVLVVAICIICIIEIQ